MPAGFAEDRDDLAAAHTQISKRMAELGIDHDIATTAAVSSIFRAADLIRNHMERSVLSDVNLSFTAFTVLWVLWIWGDQEARFVAERSGISRGTLTGVVGTLERRDLVRRDPHPDDKRSIIVALTEPGRELITEIFPVFHAEEVRISADLSTTDKWRFTETIRSMLARVDEFTP